VEPRLQLINLKFVFFSIGPSMDVAEATNFSSSAWGRWTQAVSGAAGRANVGLWLASVYEFVGTTRQLVCMARGLL